MHPYEVAQTLRTRAKHESIRLNYGSLYNVVEALEKRGLVRARETVREGRRPERTIYEITDDGAREMVDWLSELVAVPAKEYLQFEAALSLVGALPPDDVPVLLQQRVVALELRLGQAKASAQLAHDLGLPRVFTLEGEYAEALLEAELAFTRGLLADLEDGSLDGLEGWRAWHSSSGAVPFMTPPSPQPTATQPDATQPDATQPDATQPDTTQPDTTQPDDEPP
jgi:DNA-binding PadR family transcriptional regulator